MSQLVERFEAAVQSLIADGPVKQRLAAAYSEFLEDLQEVELPAGINTAFHDLHAALHRIEPIGRESAVKASVQKMSVGEAIWHAGTILRLYAELLAQPRRADALKIVESSAEAPPRFLVGST